MYDSLNFKTANVISLTAKRNKTPTRSTITTKLKFNLRSLIKLNSNNKTSERLVTWAKTMRNQITENLNKKINKLINEF